MSAGYFTSFVRRRKKGYEYSLLAYRLDDPKKPIVLAPSSKANLKSVKIQRRLRMQALSGLKKLGL